MSVKKVQHKGGRPVKTSGKRLHVIKAKLTDVELEQRLHLQRESGLNRTELIRKRVLGSKFLTINTTEIIALFDPIGTELGRAGNNINQLARHVNLLHKQNKLDPPMPYSIMELTLSLNCLRHQYGLG